MNNPQSRILMKIEKPTCHSQDDVETLLPLKVLAFVWICIGAFNTPIQH
jgi:hypothetical protein